MRSFILLLLVTLLAYAASELDIEHLLMHDGLFVGGSPTMEPSAEPTANPTDAPTSIPTLSPSNKPSLSPTIRPTVSPTRFPTIRPTPSPTNSYKPTVSPTARPTSSPTKLNLIAVTVYQSLYGVTPDQYFSDRVRQNLTLQHTLSLVLTNVQPENVQNIQLTNPSGRRLASKHAAGNEQITAQVTYNIIFHDSTQTYDSVVNDLVTVSNNGVMNRVLHQQATIFGATALTTTNVTATYTQPYFQDRSVSEKLTGAEIAGLVIGIVLCLGLIAIVLVFAKDWIRDNSTPTTNHEVDPQPADSV